MVDSTRLACDRDLGKVAEGVAAGVVDSSDILLVMRLNGDEIDQVSADAIPCELTSSRQITPGAIVEFEASNGARHTHSLGELSGWAHFSLRVHAGLACQADCAVTATETYDPQDLMSEKGLGIRFQPFFLPGSKGDPEELRGRGLFRRGLHFSGTVTPGSVRLSCECDECHRSFHIQSFHAGFSNCEYMYSASGKYTLIMDSRVEGAPGALGTPELALIKKLESSLPLAPDGTAFKYLNPFRCPHCSAPYIDFERFPDQRPTEYYGNCLFGMEPIRYNGPPAPTPVRQKSWLGRLMGAR